MRRLPPTLCAALLLCAGLSGAQPQDQDAGATIDKPSPAEHSPAESKARRQKARPVVIPVRDVDNPGRHPFQAAFDQTLQFLLPSAESTFTVPDGARLVIEHISVLAQGQASASAPWGLSCAISATAAGEAASLVVTLAPIGFQGGINQVSAGNLYGRAYADGGTVVTTVCTRVNFSSRSIEVQVSIVGHLVDEQGWATRRSAPWDAPRVALPLEVEDVENPGRNPFQRSFHVDPLVQEGVSIAVPEGRRLVIEHLSLQTVAASPAVCTIATTADGQPAELFIPSAGVTGVSPVATDRTFIGNERVRAYADAGSMVTTRCFNAGGLGGPAGADVSIIGHLVRR